MTAFSNIPPHAVLPLGTYKLEDLKRAAARADQRLLYCDLSEVRDKAGVVAAMGESFGLPKHFGQNLDALYDCLTDLKPQADAQLPGFVVILEHVPDSDRFDPEQRDALLDVFRDAADYFFDKKTAFRVFYSVASKVPANRL